MKKLILCVAALLLGSGAYLMVSPQNAEKETLLFPSAPLPITEGAGLLSPADSFLSLSLAITAIEAENLLADGLANPLYDVKGQKLDDSYGQSVADVLVERTGPPSVAFEDDYGVVTVPFRFESLVRWKGKVLGIPSRTTQEIFGGGALLLKIKPRIDRDWKIHLEGSLSVRWKENPALSVLGQKIGVARFLASLLEGRSKDLLGRAEEELNRSARLRERAQSHWEQLSRPILLTQSPSLYLTVKPLALSIPPFRARGGVFFAPLALRCALSVSTEATDPLPSPSPLPELTSLPPNLESGVLINLDAFLSYRALGENLFQKPPAPLQIPGGGKVEIKGATLYGSGEKLVAAADISGVSPIGTALSGRVYLGGKPVYSRDDRTLRMEEVEFDEDSTQGLMRAASWIVRPLLADKLKEALVFPLDELRERTMKSLAKTLRGGRVSEELTLEGSVGAMELEGLSLEAGGVRFSFSLGADVSLKFGPGEEKN